MYISNKIYFIYYYYNIKNREQWKHKTSGTFDLFFVKLIHQAHSVAVVATPSEFSRC